MTLRLKLLFTFAAVLGLVSLQAALAIALLTQVADGSAELVRPALARVDTLAHLESDVLRLHTLEHSLLEDADRLPEAQLRAEMDGLQQAVDGLLQQYRSQPLDERRRSLIDQIQTNYTDLVRLQSRVQELNASGQHDLAVSAYYDAEPGLVQLDDELHQLRHVEYAVIQDLRDDLAARAESVRWPVLLAVGVVGAAELWLGWAVSHAIVASLQQLRAGARRIAREEFAERVPIPPELEFAELAAALNDVMVTLDSNRAERARLEAERLQLLQQNLAHVVRAQEDERARVSRELHDEAGQALTALQYDLKHLARLCPNPPASTQIARVMDLAATAGRQISSLARDLRPAVLDDLGLVAALRSYCREYSERVGLRIHVAVQGSIPRMPPEVETALFRVVQEALTNTARHAAAEQARVDIACVDDRVEACISDDGRGFDPRQVSSGLGLVGMRERVALIGGDMHVDSRPGGGTRITLRVRARVSATSADAVLV